MEKILSESINVSPKLKCTDDQEQIQQDEPFRGVPYYHSLFHVLNFGFPVCKYLFACGACI